MDTATFRDLMWRILDRVTYVGDCWVFASQDGRIRVRGKTYTAHRVMWGAEHSSVLLRSTCGTRNCVNFRHWEEYRIRRVPRGVLPCVACERPTRPAGRTLKEYPDTLAQRGDGKCWSCFYSTVEPLDATLKQVVRERFPKDVWVYFGVEEI